MTSHSRRALTFTDLVVVLAILAFGAALAFRTAGGRSAETANRVKCASNLRQIGQAMLLYANDNKGAFPRTRHDNQSAAITQYTGINAAQPIGRPDSPAANDVTAAIFLLRRTQDIGSDAFVCPSTALTPMDIPAGGEQRYSNFPGGQNLAYGIANPYPTLPLSLREYKWNATITAEFAVAADMNPGGAALGALQSNASAVAMQQGNSKNHQGAGQNVLYADGHVEWTQNPFVGAKRDNIYTVADAEREGGTSATIVGQPTWAGDSVILPVATINPGVRAATVMGMPVVQMIVIAGVAILVGVGVVLFLVMKRKPAPGLPPPLPPRV